MANYKDIKGFHVQSLSTDPAASPITAGSWASGGSMNTARRINSGSAGSQTAGLVFGGGPPYKSETESYDGTSWTEKGDLNQARRSMAGMGTNTAALGAAGYNGATRNTVESFNGTGWTELTENNTAREEAGGAGMYFGASEQRKNPDFYDPERSPFKGMFGGSEKQYDSSSTRVPLSSGVAYDAVGEALEDMNNKVNGR